MREPQNPLNKEQPIGSSAARYLSNVADAALWVTEAEVLVEGFIAWRSTIPLCRHAQQNHCQRGEATCDNTLHTRGLKHAFCDQLLVRQKINPPCRGRTIPVVVRIHRVAHRLQAKVYTHPSLGVAPLEPFDFSFVKMGASSLFLCNDPEELSQ